jgi:hypothetical protein
MGVLIVLLAVLLNLSFGQTQTPSDTPSGVIDTLVEQHKQAIQKIREKYGITKTRACQYTVTQLTEIASKHNMLRVEEGRPLIQMPDPKGKELRLYQIDENTCNIISYTVNGTLSPPSPESTAPIGEQILAKQDLKYKVDVSLFQVLFQLLMYGAGIFWAVRVARNFIKGDMYETAVAFFQGFIIIATMYVLYRLM